MAKGALADGNAPGFERAIARAEAYFIEADPEGGTVQSGEGLYEHPQGQILDQEAIDEEISDQRSSNQEELSETVDGSTKDEMKKILAEIQSGEFAKEYIDDCEYKIPYQILEEGIQLEKKGRTQNALNKYQDALSKVKIDTVIIPILNKRITQIALLWMIEAEKKLKNGEYIQAYNLVKHVSEFSIEGQKELQRFKSWVLLGEGKKYQEFGFIGKAMGKYAEGLELNRDLIFEVNALQYRAGIQMAKLAKEADEYEEIQLAIYSLEFARELSGGIGNKNEDLLIKLKEKMRLLDNYKSRLIINKKMDSARKILSKARMEKLVVGQTIPQIQELLGDPHEKIIGDSGTNLEKQLWIYFMNEKSLHLTFSKFIFSPFFIPLMVKNLLLESLIIFFLQ